MTYSKFDPAVEQLLNEMQLSRQSQPDLLRLWLVDEHPLNPNQLAFTNDKLLFISNRFDQFQLAKNSHLSALFSDFKLDDVTPQDEVYIRVPKERALVHHLINGAFKILKPGGNLFLSGFKGEGVKTHLVKAETLFGQKAELRKAKNQLWICKITKHAEKNVLLDDQQYQTLRKVKIDGMEFWTKPGLYGWNKIDYGSQLLAECLKKHASENPRVLDLGCGYGYLSLRAGELSSSSIVATDNCAAALIAARKNLEIPNIQVVASDAGHGLEGEFDLILCNPPFHQGFSINPDLHPKFLKNTRQLLSKSGAALYVVNQFVPLEKVSAETGLNYQEVHRENGFKIIQLTRL